MFSVSYETCWNLLFRTALRLDCSKCYVVYLVLSVNLLSKYVFIVSCNVTQLPAIRPGSQWYQTGVLSTSVSFLEIGISHRVPNQGSTVCGGWQPFILSPEIARWGRKFGTGRYHGEAARCVIDKVPGDVFARFHAIAVKCLNRARNSQFCLWGPVLRAATTAV
jgi:hypothetical protein